MHQGFSTDTALVTPRMDPPSRASSSRVGSRRAVIVVLAAVVGIAALGLTVTLANASSAQRVADNAALLHWTNSTQGSAALARSAIGQAVLFALSRETGAVTDEAMTAAIQEAESSLQAFRNATGTAPPALIANEPELTEELQAFDAAATEVLRLLASQDDEAADRLRVGGYESAYESLITAVESSQNLAMKRISNNQDRAALAAQMTRLLVTLLIPAVALIVYWRIARRQLRERRLEMSAKITTQREMVAGVSHELRTPLTSIYGFSEVLLSEGDIDPEVAREAITLINIEAADLSRMVDDLLAAARIDMGELTFMKTEFVPAIEIEGIAEPFRRAGHDIRVECGEAAIVADVERFRHILRNLMSNAIKHGGRTCIVSGSWSDDSASFTVMDDGPGVEDRPKNHLFEPFANSGEQALLSGSVGLGLSVALATAHGMGGELSYERSDGWSRFSLQLPQSAQDAPGSLPKYGVATRDGEKGCAGDTVEGSLEQGAPS